jgi:PAS domain S-box-containing protein
MPITTGIGSAAAKARAPRWSWRLCSLVGLSSVLLLAMSALASRNLRTDTLNVGWVMHTEQVRYQLSQIARLLVDAHTSARGYALTRKPSILNSYQDATGSLEPALVRLQQLVFDNPKQRSLAAKLAGMVPGVATSNEALLQHARDSDSTQAGTLSADDQAQQLTADALSTLSEMQSEEDRLLQLRQLSEDRSRLWVKVTVWATGGLGVLLIVLVFYFTRRDEAILRRTERELATTLHSIGDAVISTDTDGSIRFMNPEAERLTGWPQASGRGKPLAEVFRIIGERTRAPVDSPAIQVLKKGKTVQLANHTILVARDGTERAIADSGAPILDDAGRVLGMVLVFRDASAERAAERKLQLRDAELQIINDHARFPIVHLDRRHHYIFVNRAYAERFGLTPEQCAGKHIREVAGELAYENVRPHIEAVLAGRTVEFESEIPYQAPLGTRWMRCIYAPVHRSEDEEVRSLVATVTDITDRKEAEEMLRRSQAALQEADRRKDEFLATLSHELRNPLAPIRTAAQILASPEISSQQLKWAQNVLQRQVGHMALLLDDLLDIARITQGKLDIRMERVTINGIVDSAVEAARPLIDGKNHHLTVTLPPEALTIEADPLRLSQVLSNLLTNAAKYTDPGGHIDLRAVSQEGVLTLSVKDNGIGIAPESIDRIFEMFSQIEGVSGRSEGGLGIGLALVKGLTELHGGAVEVRSDGLGHGSEFVLRLPIAITDSASRLIGSIVGPPAIAGARRVLIADDNRDAADSLGMLLGLAGHEVRVAHSGQTALSLAQVFRPDTALLDIGMPDLSGYEVARQLRREPWGIGIRLIALTGWGQTDDRRRAHEAGFDYHLTKPIDPDALAALITNDDLTVVKARQSSGHAADQG